MSSSQRVVGAISAALAGALALVINGWIGLAIWRGFTFDWYTHAPVQSFDGRFILVDVFLTALITAAITVLITVKLVKKRWDDDAIRYDSEPEEGETRDVTTFTGRSVARYGLFSAIFLSIAVAVFFVGAGTEFRGETFVAIKVAAGVIAGIYAGWGVSVALVRGLASGTIVEADQGNIARMSLGASRHPKKVLAVVLALTILLGSGLPLISTSVDVADVLPRGDHNTRAAKNVTSNFKSAYTQQNEVMFRIDPDACREISQQKLPDRQTETNCGKITDEVYVRAIEEFYRYIKRNTDIEYQIALPSFYKLINWTEAGGQDAPDSAFALPPTDPQGEVQYRTVDEGVWASISDAVTPTLSPQREVAVGLYMVEGNANLTQREVGRQFIDARDSYLEWVEDRGEYPIFVDDNKPLIVADRPAANAHSSKLAQEDFALLFPLIVGFIAALLWIAFRHPRAILVSGTTLAVGTIWTYGFMGHVGIPLNTLNLVVIPILLGNGIDYSIHMMTEFAEHKSELKPDDEAFSLAGDRAGFAMFVATATTVVGLGIMMVSPSLLMAQMGLLAAVGMGSIFLLAVTFIPAQLAVFESSEGIGASFERSELMPRFGAWVSDHKFAIAAIIIVVTLLTAYNARNLTIETFGDPAQNWPEEDWLRQENDLGLAEFYDQEDGPTKKTNIVVFEGDLYDHDTHVYIEDVFFAVGEKPNVDTSTSRHIPFLVDVWLTVKDGAIGAPIHLGQQQSSDSEYYSRSPDYPRSRDEIRTTFNEMFDEPVSTFASLFIDHPEHEIGTMTVAVEGKTYPQAEASWQQVWDAIRSVDDQRPDDVRVAFVGNTATNYLFITGQLPWLNYMTLASLAAVALLVGYFTRSWKATAAVAGVVGVTAIWFAGILPTIGVGLAITLMLPIVFITSIGTDYAVHLLWNVEKTGSAWRTFGTTGKAVMFSALTDIGAFVIFSRVRNLAVRDAVVTTALAIAVVFLVTVMIVGIAHEVEEPDEPEEVDEELAEVRQSVTR